MYLGKVNNLNAKIYRLGNEAGHNTTWTTNGAALEFAASTVTDTASTAGATVAHRTMSSFGAPTFSSTNGLTATNASNIYIAGAPVAGTNTSITNSYALYVNSGASYFGGAVSVTSLTATGLSTAGIVTNTLAGVLGTVGTTGSGNVVLANSPTLTGGKLTLAAGTSSYASINVPSAGSTNPSAPVSGDLWSFSGALKYYDGANSKYLGYNDFSNVSTGSILGTTYGGTGVNTAIVSSDGSGITLFNKVDTAITLSSTATLTSIFTSGSTAVTLEANTTYSFRFFAALTRTVGTTSTASIRLTTSPTVPTFEATFTGNNPASVAVSGTQSSEAAIVVTSSSATTGADYGVLIQGFLTTGSSSTTLTPQFSQSANGGFKIYAGSHIQLTKINTRLGTWS
jgi:hypothetical protein